MIAKAVIIDDRKINTVSIEISDYSSSSIKNKTNGQINVKDIKLNTVSIENLQYSSSIVKYKKVRYSSINEVLPFRVKFADIKIPGYNPNNIPGIGIQIIGYSNYILWYNLRYGSHSYQYFKV